MFDFLDQSEIKEINEWLTLKNKEVECPLVFQCKTKCRHFFPIKPLHLWSRDFVDDDIPLNVMRPCPCELYGTNYVTKRAEQIVRIWEEEHGNANNPTLR